MKITERIENYADLSAEEKLKALEELELEDNSESETKLKQMISKANAEAADYKRKWKETLDQTEREKIEREEREKERENELETLRKDKKISEFKAQYIGMGYSTELASEMAEALSNGDTIKVAEIQKKFLDIKKAEWEKDSLNNQPDLSKGDDKKPMTKEEIMAIKDPIARQKAIANNINLFE